MHIQMCNTFEGGLREFASQHLLEVSGLKLN